jgi:hypothetical protein
MSNENANVEELSMRLAELLTTNVSGVPDVDLALMVGEAHNVLEDLDKAYGAFRASVQAECDRQEAARKEKLASVGLAKSATTGATAGAKRGRKTKEEKAAAEAAKAEAANPAGTLDTETEVHLDAE